MSSEPETWYREGLAFTCTRCGDCCRGAPGYVWVTDEEIQRLAALRGESPEVFTRRFVRQVGPRMSLIEKPNGDCVFWENENGCTVYSARPKQCRTWPFWPANLTDESAWERTCAFCPGSGQGRTHSLDEIRASIQEMQSK